MRHLIKEWSNAALSFNSTYFKNRIFFSEEQCELINTLNNELSDINEDTRKFLTSFGNVDDQIKAIRSEDKKFIELKKRSQELINSKILELNKQLENEFRQLLGVEMKNR